MLNYIWAVMIVIGIIYGAITGHMKEVTEAALQSAQDAVTLCFTMTGVMAFWVGLMQVAEESGLIAKLTRMLSPFISFMFPRIPQEHKSRDYISTNMIANVLGLGWACTPAGLKAMEELAKLQEERGVPEEKRHYASNEMCTFLIINVSSLQLIPVNMIAYRAKYGSADPTAIVGPAILATAVSTAVAVIFCKVVQNVKRLRN